MDQQISVSVALYNRLAQHASGFDTPENVLERLLDFYEQNSGEVLQTKSNVVQAESQELDLVFFPRDEDSFKEQLLVSKQAWIALHYLDGTTKLKNWKIKEFRPSSNLRGNLFSGYLRGWRDKGIYKAEVAINKGDIS